MKTLILTLTTFLSFLWSSSAQNTDYSGVYQLPASTTLYLNKEHSFAILAYATLITGQWHIEDQKMVLVPQNPETPFTVYGRVNPNLSKNTKWMFSQFTEDTNFFSIESPQKTPKSFIPVLNEGANCVPYPLLYEHDAPTSTLYFASLPSCDGSDEPSQLVVYEYTNQENFNDFIVLHAPANRYYKNYIIDISSEGLTYQNKSLHKTVHPSEEDLELLQKVKPQPSAPSQLFSNLGYNYDLPQPDQQYRFDKKKNAYIDPTNLYTHLEKDDFDNFHQVLEYKKLPVHQTFLVNTLNSSRSILHFSCE